MHFDVKGWSPKIDVDIFEEPENHKVLVDLKMNKTMIFSESRLDMAIQGCNLVLRVVAQNRYGYFRRARKSESTS